MAVETQVGRLWVAYRDGQVCFAMLAVDEEAFRAACARRLGSRPSPADNPALSTRIQDRLTGCAEVPFDLRACTPFQRAVLTEVAAIPPGEVRTYGEVAAAVGRPQAARAVGEVLRTNPIPVLIPCHRVVRSTGGLGNYTPRPELKRLLLAAEGAFGDAPENVPPLGSFRAKQGTR